tara:strand:- start:229 stop:447 length:219 start_codon:yes stop_codon:yes gene_type:complete
MKKAVITTISTLLDTYTTLTVCDPEQFEYTINEENKYYTLRIYSTDNESPFFETVMRYSIGLSGQILKIIVE